MFFLCFRGKLLSWIWLLFWPFLSMWQPFLRCFVVSNSPSRGKWAYLLSIHEHRTAEQRGHLPLWTVQLVRTKKCRHHLREPQISVSHQSRQWSLFILSLGKRSSLTVPTLKRVTGAKARFLFSLPCLDNSSFKKPWGRFCVKFSSPLLFFISNAFIVHPDSNRAWVVLQYASKITSS